MPSFDRLAIDTPEQIALELPLAGVGSRFLAVMLDSLLQIAAFLVLAIMFVVWASTDEWERRFSGFVSQTIGAVVLVLAPFCLYWGYFALFEIFWHGKTPGKRVAGIRVIHQSGRPMTAIECIGRNLMRGVDILPGMYGVGLVSMMCSSQNRRLGDYVAGTIVVHDKSLDSVAAGWVPRATMQLGEPELRSLSSDELMLIETYLQRRYELDTSVRTETAQRIVSLISQKTGIQKKAEQGDDDFLETVARQLRDGGAFKS
ncbi:MAG: RDD family protein [Acidobacteria bacterium]|nr:RDD family protein [Acidobacteriota bacterium]